MSARVTNKAADSASVPAPRGGAGADGLLRLQVTYQAHGGATVHVSGEVDLLSAPQLLELVNCRLRSELSVVVLDLSEVSFMSVAGARLLTQLATFARHNRTEFRINVGGSRAVWRVLRATGLREQLPLESGG